MARAFSPQSLPPIRVTPTGRPAQNTVERSLFVLLRIVAATLIIRALYIWFCLTGFMPIFAPDYVVDMGTGAQLMIIGGAAIASLIAGLGLWLLASWGAVLWLVLVGVDAVVFFLVPELSAVRPFVVVANAVLVALYLILALMLRRQARSESSI
ncbi:MAG: DUF6163 family protein [Pseudomonadota bacterium]